VTDRDVAALGAYGTAVEAALTEATGGRIVERMWQGDHTVWGPQPDEIANRLGWLRSPEASEEALPRIRLLADAVRAEGFEHILLLGMGGSSLAPEVFALALGGAEGYPDLAVLDSTDPRAVISHAEGLDLTKTLFIVSTKSGGTVETFSFFKFFYNRIASLVGPEGAGSHFVAITDPGSGLQDTAQRYRFRETFLNDPNIGGRYSALSMFGIVPATLAGVDVPKLLESAKVMALECGASDGRSVGENPGAWLGVVMGEMARNHGRDKLTLFASPSVAAFGPWVEQLIAESTGKEGTGILPVVEEPAGTSEAYGDDRLFVYLTLRGEEAEGPSPEELRGLGHPVLEIPLDDVYDLGGEMFRWEVATAVAGWRLGINPFDQPNVESAKVQARRMVAEYGEKGELPEPEPTVEEGGMAVYAPEGSPASSVEEALRGFFDGANPGGYVSLQAYLPPSGETTEVLQGLRAGLRDRLRLATTLGYGPRFLHSTGQLHKGDGGNGLFLQITSDNERDASIPDEAGEPEASLSFGVLEAAQALGDRQALLDAGRRVVRVHLSGNLADGLERLSRMLS